MFAKHCTYLSQHFLQNQIYSNIRLVTTTPHSLQVICPKGVEPKAWRFFWANPDLVNYLGDPRFRNWNRSRRKPNSEQLSQETLQDRWRTCTPRNLWRNRDQTWKITSQTLHLAFRFHLFSMFILLFKAFRAMKHFFQSPGLRTAHSRRSQWLNSPMGPISKVGKFWSTSSSKTKLERISWTTFGGCFVVHVCSSVVLYSPTTNVQNKQHNIHFVS